MNFLEAIGSGFRNYFRFKGTATRSEYWYWILFIGLVGFVSWVPLAPVDLTVIWSLIVFFPTLSLLVRRLRDAGYRATWILLPSTGLIAIFLGVSQFLAEVWRLNVSEGLELLGGNFSQTTLDAVFAYEELRSSYRVFIVALVYLGITYLQVGVYFTSKRSKSIEEGNKLLATRSSENPQVKGLF